MPSTYEGSAVDLRHGGPILSEGRPGVLSASQRQYPVWVHPENTTPWPCPAGVHLLILCPRSDPGAGGRPPRPGLCEPAA